MTTTSDFMKELRVVAQQVAAASRDHSLLPEIRRKFERSLAGIDPESVGRTTADYRAGQAEIILAILTAIGERADPPMKKISGHNYGRRARAK